MDNPYRYCGEYVDEETGFIYLRNRYYSPDLGRFTSEDPYWSPANMIYGDNGTVGSPDLAAIVQSGNRYAYAMNNPIKFVDPSGNKNIVDSVAKKIWKAGAEHYLSNKKGYYLTATLLEMSTGASGQKFTSNNGEYASNLLKNDLGFHNAINDKLWEKGTSKGETWVWFNLSYSFENGDAFAALHNVDAIVAGYVNDKGQWVVNVQVTDTFDFTEFKNPLAQETFQQGFLWFMNDVAVVNTNMGVLQPVEVVIRFSDTF